MAFATNPVSIVRSVCNYSTQRTKLHDFLTSFESSSESVIVPNKRGQGIGKSSKPQKSRKYLDSIKTLRQSKVLNIEVDDILEHYGCKKNAAETHKATDVLTTLLTNTPRAMSLFYDVVEEVRKEQGIENTEAFGDYEGCLRRKIESTSGIPTRARVPYLIRLIPSTSTVCIPIHGLRASHIGSLIKLDGIVSKVTNVKPMLSIAVYRCEECGEMEFQFIDGPQFVKLSDCSSQNCRSAKRRGTLELSIRDSHFVRRQEAKIQEMPQLVPAGAVPRQIKVLLYDNLTRVLRPGMSATLSGVYLPVMNGGWVHPKARDSTETILEVHGIEAHRSTGTSGNKALSEATRMESERLIRSTPDLYERLSESIAPAIHGHGDVKKALLLQLTGGATETLTDDSLKLRGDIHMLLMGDPGIAKSQLLLRVCAVAPRAHFTCGKGASGVGLTASVVKDPISGEFTLEGGAIVMADNGICCVDEFDKMQESDRTAIHEVMEQQTVSISKAGLTATLNARTTILAAANPTFGRYDITKSAVANIGLPAALLSRFDIVFLLLDSGGDYDGDLQMARHLLKIHRDRKVTTLESADGCEFQPIPSHIIRDIIARAKEFHPKLTSELADEIVEEYVALRNRERQERGSLEESTYTTPRTLFGLLRLSQALARLRFSNLISQEDFREALRLMHSSKDSLLRSRANASGGSRYVDKQKEAVLRLMMELGQESRRSKKAGGWVDFMVLLGRARKEASVSGDVVEETVQEMVASGRAQWNGANKERFLLDS